MDQVAFPVFEAPYAPDDVMLVRALLAEAGHAPESTPEAQARIRERAEKLVGAIRDHAPKIGGIEELLREYSLSTREGLALMVLAEALLRVPDADTANRLIEDKLGQGNFGGHEVQSDTLLMAASTWMLGLTAKIVQPFETPEGILRQLTKRLGMPAIRTAARQAMKIMGNHFVYGQTIEDALKRSHGTEERAFRHSFDMLGEGARTAEDAQHYFAAYAAAIEAIARDVAAPTTISDGARPGISVKLSGLHPRYEAICEERIMAELLPGVIALAKLARKHDLAFTIDAEEADRLELSLDLIARVMADPALHGGWRGFGIAVQAYQKRAGQVIDFMAELAERHAMPITIRLVKGAYWDSEIKRAQERGLRDYPVFTRKAATDLNYLHCARKLLDLRPHIYPQFATHNALTVAAIIEMAGGVEGYEFQRLHGMGDALFKSLRTEAPALACRTYAPVGPHRDLLAYLVRRILENGANTSFVSRVADRSLSVDKLLTPPASSLSRSENARHPKLPRPRDLFGAGRINSQGYELGSRARRDTLRSQLDNGAAGSYRAVSLINGQESTTGKARLAISPVDGQIFAGEIIDGTVDDARAAIAAARKGHLAWAQKLVERRAAILDQIAALLEERQSRFLHLLQVEAGKTIGDAIAELREAVDFLRYYAVEAREKLIIPQTMPGPTGESNRVILRSRGVFVAISPWNFPLAIFTGQIAAALVAGNAVVAKPAEQTPLIAAEMVRLMHEAGVLTTALHLVIGDGEIGAALVAEQGLDGVAFTGSVAVSRQINRTLAAKDGPIVPFIAETGGVNAMIVDATALPEQVADDVITSAFRSAGQRCSALRLLCVQEDIADRVIELIIGAARELPIGDPRDFATAIGPVIDGAAKTMLADYIAAPPGKILYAGSAPARGFYIGPHIIALNRVSDLDREVFGPILHVVRYRSEDLDAVLIDIAKSGYGLTLGIHSRIDSFAVKVVRRLPVGNVYVNRNMIGAVVGSQPFGGNGLSGTGPKAGGPHYLTRFAIEQTLSINTAAAGGNAALIALEDIEE